MKNSLIKIFFNHIYRYNYHSRHIILVIISIAMLSFQKMAMPQKGWATYYGMKWQGRRTASGERYHKDSLTCAHRNYKFGTLLKVTYLATGKTVQVRVNDRGPNKKGRIVDLSYKAAKELGMISVGVAWVQVEIIQP